MICLGLNTTCVCVIQFREVDIVSERLKKEWDNDADINHLNLILYFYLIAYVWFGFTN